MKYDLSQVPRPLSLPSLRCFSGIGINGGRNDWFVVVTNDYFQTFIARRLTMNEADKIVEEVHNVLRAARLLAGTPNLADSFDVR